MGIPRWWINRVIPHSEYKLAKSEYKLAKIQIRLPRNFHLDHRFCFPSQIRVATAPQRCSIRTTGNIRSRLRAGMRASAWFRRPSHRTCWDGSAINVSGPSGCSWNSQLAVPGARDLLLLPVSVPPVGITLPSWATGAMERIRLVPVDGSSGSDGRLTGARDRPVTGVGSAWPGTGPMPVSRAEARIIPSARGRLAGKTVSCITDLQRWAALTLPVSQRYGIPQGRYLLGGSFSPLPQVKWEGRNHESMSLGASAHGWT